MSPSPPRLPLRATSVADDFTYEAAPAVTALSPSPGRPAGGTVGDHHGTQLHRGSAVDFGSSAASSFTVNSATSITATAPAGSAGTVDATVTTPVATSATSSADDFTYDAAPTVTAVSPLGGPLDRRRPPSPSPGPT